METSNRFCSSILLFLSDCFVIIVIIRMINSIKSFFKYTTKKTQTLLFATVLEKKTFYTNWQRLWEAGVETFFSIYLFIHFLFNYI